MTVHKVRLSKKAKKILNKYKKRPKYMLYCEVPCTMKKSGRTTKKGWSRRRRNEVLRISTMLTLIGRPISASEKLHSACKSGEHTHTDI